MKTRVDYKTAAEYIGIPDDIDSLVREYIEPVSGDHPFVYFMLCDSPGKQIKIGFAGDVSKRLGMVRGSCPYEIRLLASFQARDARAVEAILHTRFAASRIRGEWFESTPGLLGFIERFGRRS